MALSWAIELAPRGVTANVVAPAATQTAMLSDPQRQSVAPRVPFAPPVPWPRPAAIASTPTPRDALDLAHEPTVAFASGGHS
jgi:NAD(P)-dependent dehydrogenase (short-subunit alcohol dehydrogenase family)